MKRALSNPNQQPSAFSRCTSLVGLMIILVFFASCTKESATPPAIQGETQTPMVAITSATDPPQPSQTNTPTPHVEATQIAQATVFASTAAAETQIAGTQYALATEAAQPIFNAEAHAASLAENLDGKGYDHDYTVRTNSDGSVTLSCQTEPWRESDTEGVPRWGVYDVVTVLPDGTVRIRFVSGGQETTMTVENSQLQWSDEYHDLVVVDEAGTPVRVYTPEYGVWLSAEPTVGITGSISDCGRTPDTYSMSDADREAYMDALTARELAYFAERLGGGTFADVTNSGRWESNAFVTHNMSGNSFNGDASVVSCNFMRMASGDGRTGNGLFGVWGMPDGNTVLHLSHDLSVFYGDYGGFDPVFRMLDAFRAGGMRGISFEIYGVIDPSRQDQITENHWGYTVMIIQINNEWFRSIYSTPTTGDFRDYFAKYFIYHTVPFSRLNTILIPALLRPE